MARQARSKAQHLRMLTQPGVDVALDQRPPAVDTRGLAVGYAYAANLELAGLRKEVPKLFARFFDRHAMQIKAAFEPNLACLELAHLSFLDAIADPVECIVCRYVDHELVGQGIDTRFAVADRGVGAARSDLGSIGAGL